MLHLVNQTKLLFWKKMYTNSNLVLYTLSRYAGVPSRFMAVASQYGIHSLRQTVGNVRLAVWKFFLQKLLVFRCAHFILSYAVLYFWCVFYVLLCVLCFRYLLV